jgi:hypothetical protein
MEQRGHPGRASAGRGRASGNPGPAPAVPRSSGCAGARGFARSGAVLSPWFLQLYWADSPEPAAVKTTPWDRGAPVRRSLSPWATDHDRSLHKAIPQFARCCRFSTHIPVNAARDPDRVNIRRTVPPQRRVPPSLRRGQGDQIQRRKKCLPASVAPVCASRGLRTIFGCDDDVPWPRRRWRVSTRRCGIWSFRWRSVRCRGEHR